MKKIIVNHMRNISTEKEFIFSVKCTNCHKEYRSVPVPFSKADITPTSHVKKIVYQELYQQEALKVANKALLEAQKHFNYCPICKSLVCNSCFMICEDIDMCIDCAHILHEKGEIVES